MSDVTVLTLSQADLWLAERGRSSLTELFHHMRAQPDFKLPADASRRAVLARETGNVLAEGGEVFVSVVDYYAGDAPEDEFVFHRFVRSGLNVEPVAQEGPWTYLVRHEDYLYGILSLALFYSWGVLVASSNLDYVFMTDHHDYLYWMNTPSKETFAQHIFETYGARKISDEDG